MSESIVNPGGRPMTGALQSALDGLNARQRGIVIRVCAETPEGSLMAPLYRALALELQLCGVRQAETDRVFRQMAQDSIDAPPLPPPTGPRVRFDPETGEMSEISDESDDDRS